MTNEVTQGVLKESKMALEERTYVDKIEVMDTDQIRIRMARAILSDGKVIAKNYHRSVLLPGDDVSSQDQRVQDIANAVWTSEVIASYQEQLK